MNNDDGMHLHNKIFGTWSSFWLDLYSLLSVTSKEYAGDFVKQNKIIAILDDQERVAGIHLYSLYSPQSRASVSSPYFINNYSSDLLSAINGTGVNSLLTMEYLTVLPEYRQKKIGWSMAMVLVGLGHCLQQELNIDAAIAPCRVDFKVDKIAKEFGAVQLTQAGIHHGISTVNMITYRDKIIIPEAVKPLVNELWIKRTVWPIQHINHLRVAAS